MRRFPRRSPFAPVAASLSAVVLAASLVACGSSDDDDAGSAATTEDESSGSTDASIPEISLVPATAPTASVPDVQLPGTIPTELQVTELTPGTGAPAVAGDTVYVNYVGVRSEDGTEFDNNYGQPPFPVTLGAGGVIDGWDQGLVGVTSGERVQLDIPSDLAYGDQPQGDVIQAGDALTFVVDVLAVVPATDPASGPTQADVPMSSEAVSELQVTELTPGTGAALAEGDTGIFNLFAARGDTGEVIDSTWEVGQPQTLTVAEGTLLPELVDGLTGMQIGGRRMLTLPPNDQLGLDPPATNLVVIAELVGII